MVSDDYWKYIDNARCDRCKHDNNLESWDKICPKCEHDYTDEDGNVYLVHDLWEPNTWKPFCYSEECDVKHEDCDNKYCKEPCLSCPYHKCGLCSGWIYVENHN